MKEKDSVSVWNFGNCIKEKCWCWKNYCRFKLYKFKEPQCDTNVTVAPGHKYYN